MPSKVAWESFWTPDGLLEEAPWDLRWESDRLTLDGQYHSLSRQPVGIDEDGYTVWEYAASPIYVYPREQLFFLHVRFLNFEQRRAAGKFWFETCTMGKVPMFATSAEQVIKEYISYGASDNHWTWKVVKRGSDYGLALADAQDITGAGVRDLISDHRCPWLHERFEGLGRTSGVFA